MLAKLSVSVLALFLLLLAQSDLFRRRIPNTLVLFGTAAALVLQSFASLTQAATLAGSSFVDSLAGLLAGFLLLLPFYLLRACSAGDVKMLAMVGAFVGPSVILQAWIYSLLAGGLLAIFFLIQPGIARRTIDNLRYMVFARAAGVSSDISTSNTAARMPYGVAIAAGSLFAAWKALPAVS